ncbi:MAG TPA: ThuA domain-containing protein, partial [Bacteroidales bacterium]|nr:ThuA domain-containing protein [Bacteroidales bacterium]
MKKLLLMLPVMFLFFSACTKKEPEPVKGLLITGNDHPAHKWKETTPVIKAILEKDSLSLITVSTNPDVLKDVSTKDYDFIILNYCNWEDPEGLTEYAKAGFISFLQNGGGLIVLHFSNGAFHKSLPGAEASDWPEYRNIVRRVWDHNGNSTHDPYGDFTVDFPENRHYITRDLQPFVTHDELYFNQVGDMTL